MVSFFVWAFVCFVLVFKAKSHSRVQAGFEYLILLLYPSEDEAEMIGMYYLA